MPAHSRAVRGVRLAPAILLAGLALPMLPVTGQAAGPAPALTVHVGYHDAIKTGQWMPVSIDVRNPGADFQGTIEIQLQDNPSKGIPPSFFQPQGAVYQIPFTLPAGAVKHVRTYVVSDVLGSPVTVRLVGGGRVVATQTGSGAATASLLVGVLSDDPTAFDEFGAIRFPSGAIARVVHLAREDVPPSAVLLRGFDLLAIDDFATDSLTASQRGAIEGYVAMGGSLLLGSGGAWRKTLAALPAAVLPLKVTGTATLPGSAALGLTEPLEVATGTPAGGVAWLRDGSRPLMIEAPLGGGLVTLATFDWAQDPAATSAAAHDLLRQVGIRSGFGTRAGSAPGIGGGAGIGTWYAGGGTGSVTQRGNLFIPALSNVPALDLPSLRLTGLLVLLYVLVVGPLNYLVLRRAGRRELAWLTVPLIAVLFAGGAYGLAAGTKGRSVQGTQIAVLHLNADWDQGYQETYTGIFAPTRGDYAIAVGGDQPAIAPIATVYGGIGPIAGSTRVHPEDATVDLLGVTAFTLRGFATESTVPAPRLSASLTLQNGRLSGVVHNGSRLTFTDALIVVGNTYERLGGLGPGGDLTVGLAAQAGSASGMPPTLIDPNTVLGQVVGSGDVSGREAQERGAVLQSLLTSSSWPLVPRITPFLIAWTHDSLQALRVNGSPPRLQSESAVVIPLSVTRPVVGAIPAGLLPARLVDAAGDVQPGPSGILLNGGTATFELTAPLAPGARLVNASVTSTNPYAAKLIYAPPVAAPGANVIPGPSTPGAAGQPAAAALTTEIWDWTAGRWVAFGLKDNATTALPDAGIDPVTGTVRIRLTATQGGVPAQMGALTLAGSIQ